MSDFLVMRTKFKEECRLIDSDASRSLRDLLNIFGTCRNEAVLRDSVEADIVDFKLSSGDSASSVSYIAVKLPRGSGEYVFLELESESTRLLRIHLLAVGHLGEKRDQLGLVGLGETVEEDNPFPLPVDPEIHITPRLLVSLGFSEDDLQDLPQVGTLGDLRAIVKEGGLVGRARSVCSDLLDYFSSERSHDITGRERDPSFNMGHSKVFIDDSGDIEFVNLQLSLDPQQQDFITNFERKIKEAEGVTLESPVFVSGGPGTGKTTILLEVARVIGEQQPSKSVFAMVYNVALSKSIRLMAEKHQVGSHQFENWTAYSVAKEVGADCFPGFEFPFQTATEKRFQNRDLPYPIEVDNASKRHGGQIEITHAAIQDLFAQDPLTVEDWVKSPSVSKELAIIKSDRLKSNDFFLAYRGYKSTLESRKIVMQGPHLFHKIGSLSDEDFSSRVSRLRFNRKYHQLPDYVLIDESQDLPYAVKFARRISKDGKGLVSAYDPEQSIWNYRLNAEGMFETLSSRLGGVLQRLLGRSDSVYKLKTNHRMDADILRAVNTLSALLSKKNLIPKSLSGWLGTPKRHGAGRMPRLIVYNTPLQLVATVKEILDECIVKDKFASSTCAILGHQYDELVDLISNTPDYLSGEESGKYLNSWTFDPASPSVKYTMPYHAKGLDLRSTILILDNDKVLTPPGAPCDDQALKYRMLLTSMTRALDRLYVFVHQSLHEDPTYWSNRLKVEQESLPDYSKTWRITDIT